VAKDNTKDLGSNWVSRYMERHPDLRSRFVPPLDKERALAQEPQIIQDWFKLYSQTREQYNIADENVHNMDEKGVMMGVIAKCRAIVSRSNRAAYMTQCGNREWVSLLECISLSNRYTSPWIIFKAKAQQKQWFKALKSSHIFLSENGWTDDELGVAWLKECFESETRPTDGGYRMLLFDGHPSQISKEATRFCIANKIILLCLPAHTTHLLQPLDVGIFNPLAKYYKKLVLDRCQFGPRTLSTKLTSLRSIKKLES
jgi:hypothetical protein